MMKLNTNNDEDRNKDYRNELLASVIEELTSIVIIIIIVILFIRLNNISNIFKESGDKIEHECIVYDIFEEDHKYYISTVIGKNPYDIEINKMDFIKYKVNDEITVLISNGKAHLMN